jgi:hypothetical protein
MFVLVVHTSYVFARTYMRKMESRRYPFSPRRSPSGTRGNPSCRHPVLLLLLPSAAAVAAGRAAEGGVGVLSHDAGGKIGVWGATVDHPAIGDRGSGPGMSWCNFGGESSG